MAPTSLRRGQLQGKFFSRGVVMEEHACMMALSKSRFLMISRFLRIFHFFFVFVFFGYTLVCMHGWNDGMVRGVFTHLTPYTLHLTPYTLHLTPYTLPYLTPYNTRTMDKTVAYVFKRNKTDQRLFLLSASRM